MNDVASVKSICYQRNKKMLYNIPLPRYNVVSPYTSHTKFQLDMRRKAEILQHNSVQKSTQTNSLTKAQRFAQMVRSPPPLASIPEYDNNDCPTLTSSSNVPGPRIQLYMDNAVPLYNFATTVRAYGNLTLDNVSPWRVYKSTNGILTCLANKSTFLAAIEILDPIDSFSLIFSFVIPIFNTYKLEVMYSEAVVFALDNLTTGALDIPLKTASGYFYEIVITSTVDCIINMSNVVITA